MGLIVAPKRDNNIAEVIAKGCWTPIEYFDSDRNSGWSFDLRQPDGSEFEVFHGDVSQGIVEWSLIGLHNCQNALAAIAAARHAGVSPSIAIEALRHFVNIKRRMEVRGVVNDITVYDDFAHHPTAIATTVDALRRRVGNQRIVAVLEPRSNTMRMGVHKDLLPESLAAADVVMFYQPNNMGWDVQPIAARLGEKATVLFSVDEILRLLAKTLQPGDHVLIMSNGGFENIHSRLLETLKQHGV
jgi:UDP-N-acetylmuramate: L-alanyl-gamma-D-glutamyl-meso-diaminopimelate ligase